MKNALATTMCVVLAMTVATRAQVPKHGITVLVPILDTRWSCEQEMGDFRALARQAIASLEPGDYFELISAHAGKPRIQLAQTIRSGDAQEMKNVDTALGKIHSYFLADASLPNALDLAMRRLGDACSKRQVEHVAIIVFTDGQVSDTHARQILQLSEKIAAKGWSLYLTGTKNTNRLLLVAAGKGSLNWSVLSETNPELWLRQMRKLGTSASSEGGKMLESALPQSAERQGSTLVRRIPQANTLADKGQRHPAEGKQDELRMKIDASVSVGAPTRRPGVKSSLGQETVREVNEPAVRPAAEPVPQKPSQRPAPHQPWLPRAKAAMRRHWWLALVPLAALGVGLVYVIAWATGEARKWDQRAGGKVRSAHPHEMGLLVLRHGDRTYQLGPLDRFHRAGIGRHPENAVRLMDESVRDHHLCIYRKGTDLMVQNLSNASIKVNTVEVKPRGRHRVGLPGTIQLNEKIKLTLEVLRPKLNRQENGSASHEKPTEKALA